MTRPGPSRAFCVLAALLVLAGCTGGDGVADRAERTPGRPAGSVLVFAAASLTDAFGVLASEFEAANPETEIQLNLAGSSALREQILEGAPADVFASADPGNMATLVDAGIIAGPAEVFAHNRLQIVVPAGNPGGVSGLSDFADDDLFIGLCAPGVPCGDFARQALAAAGIEASIDTNEPDVRALLTKIAADELDAGLVYVTDVLAAGDEVEGIEIAAQFNVQADYLVASLADVSNRDAAEAFVAFVLSDAGQALLTEFGFARP